MIRRIGEYVAADRALAREYIAALETSQDETPAWRAANGRAWNAADVLPERVASAADRLAGWINRRLYLRAWDLGEARDRVDGGGAA